MGLLHHHRDRPATVKYQMREKLFSVGDDFWVVDEAGDHAFKVDGKAARLRDVFVLEDASGAEVARIKERALSVREKMSINLDGRSATVKKALVGLRDRFHVELDGGEDLKVHGNVVDHEYEVEQDGTTVATVSKKWFRARDTYGVEVRADADVPLLLAITVAVDHFSHD